MVRDYLSLSSFSDREIDKNGFMHVKNCIVTKSEVNQYRGNEIPEWERLGLDPNKIYDVLRPAEEIERTLLQMKGLPILDDHDDIHDAAHPQKHIRIGSMGTNPEFKEPEVSTELTFWNKREIDDIQSKQRDNLSMGYDYTAVLENGEYNGKKYQIRMKDIVWNHVALVDKGRVDGAKVSDKALDVNLPSRPRPSSGISWGNEKVKGFYEMTKKGVKTDHDLLTQYINKLADIRKRTRTGILGEGGNEGLWLQAGKEIDWARKLQDALSQHHPKDSQPFSQKEAERRLLPNKREDFMQRLVAAYRNIFRRSGHMGMDAKNWRTPPKTNDPRAWEEYVRTLKAFMADWKSEKSHWIKEEKSYPEGSAQRKKMEQSNKKAEQEYQEASRLLANAEKKAAGAAKMKQERINERAEAQKLISWANSQLQEADKKEKAGGRFGKADAENMRKNARMVIKEQTAILKQLGKDKLPMAGSKTGDRNMATKKKRNGDAEPAVGGSGEVEEIKENRVIAGMKALLAEFDNTHEEAGIDPGVTDEESACLDKIRDWMDSFHNQGADEPGEEAGTSMDPMDEDPEGMDEDPEEKKKEEMGEDEDWPDNGKSPTGDRRPRRAMDAATIEKRITAKFKAKDRALDECSDLIGSVSKARVLDSAMDVYAHALKTNGIEIPKGANLDGLRGMVMMLKKSRVGDSLSFTPAKPTGIDAQVQETINKSPYAPRY